MHVCEKCGYESEGRFCPVCGTERSDEKLCPQCGTKVSDSAKFCINCGAKLGGKAHCPQCGAEAEEGASFCGQCGTLLSRSQGLTVSHRANSAVGNAETVFSVSGIICLILSVLFAVIFVFLCGVTVTVNKGSTTQMIYYYFGDAYKEIDEMRQIIMERFDFKKIGGVREFGLYFPVAVGTVVSVLGIVGTVAFAAVTCVQSYRRLNGNTRVRVAAPAISSYLCYTLTAVLFLASVSGSTNTPFEMSVKVSSVTLAGLITGGVLLGLGLLLISLSNGKEFRSFNAKSGAIFATVISAFSVVAIALSALPCAGIRYMNLSMNMSVTMAKTDSSLFVWMRAILEMFQEDETVSKLVMYSAVGSISVVATAVLSAVSLIRKLSGLCEMKNKSNIILSLLTVAASVLYLVFSVIFLDYLVEQAGESNIEKIFTVPIVIVVITVLALIVEIVSRFVCCPRSA